MRTKSPPAAERTLLAAAAHAARNSHSPYSRFPVGAALLTEDGTVFTGCNVENASYGLTICAERVAVSTAVQAGCRQFAAIAVVAETDSPVAPWYRCR
jgi:cytidine deaminase